MIDHGKHRGGGAKTESEGCDHCGGEDGGSSQLPECVFQVLSEALEPNPSPGFAGYVFDERKIAELAHRRCARLFRRLAAVLAILDVHSEMSLNLLIELCFTFTTCKPGEEAHALSPSGVRCMTAPMTSTMWRQRLRSEASCFFPAAVIR